MQHFKAFILSVKPVLITLGISLFCFGTMFILMHLEMAVFYYTSLLILFLVCLYLAVLFVAFKRTENLKTALKEARLAIKTLEEEKNNERRAITDYFLVWVHQMKTPITAAKLLAEEQNNGMRQELICIETYTNMALNYLKLINPSTDTEFSEVAIHDLISPLLKRYSVFFIHDHIRLDYTPIKDKILTDGKWSAIMIEQILSNAIKYAKGKSVKIDYDRQKQILSICDTGIGIRPEDLPKIFDKGFAGFNGRYNEKSTGLGLFLVQKIAKRLNQTVRVTSTLHQGTCFYIDFHQTDLTKL